MEDNVKVVDVDAVVEDLVNDKTVKGVLMEHPDNGGLATACVMSALAGAAVAAVTALSVRVAKSKIEKIKAAKAAMIKSLETDVEKEVETEAD